MELESHYKIYPFIKTEDETVNTDIKRLRMTEVASLAMEIKNAYTNYFQNHLLLKAVKEVARENNPELLQIAPKVQQILKAQDVTVLNLGQTNQESLNILGLKNHHKNWPSIPLSYCDKIKFNTFVEEKLLNSCFKIEKIAWKRENELPQKIKNSKDTVFSKKVELLKSADSQFVKIYESLSLYRSLIGDLIKMRLGLLESLKSNMMPWSEVRCEYLELETKILEQRIFIHMFTENYNMPQAAKKICDALQEEYEGRKSELEKLKKDEEAYKNLDGTEYDDVLKIYRKYKREHEYTNWLATELSR